MIIIKIKFFTNCECNCHSLEHSEPREQMNIIREHNCSSKSTGNAYVTIVRVIKHTTEHWAGV